VKIILILLLLSSNLVFSQDCPEGTWNRNQYTGPGGGLYTGPGGGLYTGPGGGLYTGPGGGMYTGPGGGLYTGPSQYCGNRPPLSYLRREGIID
jgi:hypothetical protein